MTGYVRCTDGQVEIRWNSSELPVEVLVRSRGALWRVSRYDRGAAILDPASPEDQVSHGPVVRPAPLDERPILLETILEV